LSEEDALREITLNQAIMLGIEDKVGSIDVGKDADLVIYNNHPLSAYSIVEKTIIDGLVYFDREHDRALRQQLEQEKQALLDKEKGKQDKPRVTTDADGQEVQR